jgi:hypothetical protein
MCMYLNCVSKHVHISNNKFKTKGSFESSIHKLEIKTDDDIKKILLGIASKNSELFACCNQKETASEVMNAICIYIDGKLKGACQGKSLTNATKEMVETLYYVVKSIRKSSASDSLAIFTDFERMRRTDYSQSDFNNDRCVTSEQNDTALTAYFKDVLVFIEHNNLTGVTPRLKSKNTIQESAKIVFDSKNMSQKKADSLLGAVCSLKNNPDQPLRLDRVLFKKADMRCVSNFLKLGDSIGIDDTRSRLSPRSSDPADDLLPKAPVLNEDHSESLVCEGTKWINSRISPSQTSIKSESRDRHLRNRGYSQHGVTSDLDDPANGSVELVFARCENQFNSYGDRCVRPTEPSEVYPETESAVLPAPSVGAGAPGQSAAGPRARLAAALEPVEHRPYRSQSHESDSLDLSDILFEENKAVTKNNSLDDQSSRLTASGAAQFSFSEISFKESVDGIGGANQDDNIAKLKAFVNGVAFEVE